MNRIECLTCIWIVGVTALLSSLPALGHETEDVRDERKGDMAECLQDFGWDADDAAAEAKCFDGDAPANRELNMDDYDCSPVGNAVMWCVPSKPKGWP